ncbi:MAG: ATP/GTP-binding protein [Anaerolineae bacterium]|nr:ATP/GTP-binding protein [Anaerolineae bacterium]
MADSFRRINVIGTTGSGKTTLARHLADCLGYRHIELDAINWQPNWTELPYTAFREAVAEAVSAEEWVLDGNYSRVRDLVWARTDTVVWLNYSLPVMMSRLWRRTWKRTIGGEVLWAGNRESVTKQLFTRDSILLWQLQTYKRRRREYPHMFAQPENAHLRIVEHNSPRATRRWLTNINCPQP